MEKVQCVYCNRDIPLSAVCCADGTIAEPETLENVSCTDCCLGYHAKRIDGVRGYERSE